ncbi:carboxypeptidase regulatory-like domain-containing protein [bacterium]|nr:carboxypeptidase regulatory-like domain-containing protein [bacterium]
MKVRSLIPVFLIISILFVGLAFGGTVKGIVTNENSGLPIEGATIFFFNQTGDSTAYAGMSGSDGSYNVDNVPDGSYSVMVESNGYELFCQAITLTGGNTTTLDIALKPIPGQGAISGKVIYKDDSTPAEGLSIEAITEEGDYFETVTDAAGNYSISVTAGKYHVACQVVNSNDIPYVLYYPNTVKHQDAQLVTVAENGSVEDINFNMPKDPQFTTLSLKVSGKITDMDGKALSGVSVGRMYGEISGLDTMFVNLLNTGMLNNSLQYADNCISDNDGQYTLNVPVLLGPDVESEEVKLIAFKLGYYSRYYNNTEDSGAAEAITVSQNTTLTDIDFTLRFGTMSGHGYLGGLVTEEGNGDAIPLVSVNILTASGEFAASVMTNEDGNYEALVPSGQYIVAVTQWNEAGLVYTEYYNNVQQEKDAELVTVQAGLQTRDINFALPAFKDLPTYDVTIQGKVVDEAGNPLEKAYVWAWTMDGAMVCAAKDSAIFTDADGNYSLRCTVYAIDTSPAQLVVLAEKENFNVQFYNGKDDFSQADYIEVSENSVHNHIDFQLRPFGTGSGQHSLSGKLTDKDGAPIVNALAVAVKEGSWNAIWALSDKDGNYTVSGLTEGSYIVEFVGEAFAPEYYDDELFWEDAEKIQVDGDISDINAVLSAVSPDSIGVVAGTIRDIDGQLISGVTVMARRGTDDIVDAHITGMDGRYSMRGLLSGDYTLYVSKHGLCSKTVLINVASDGNNDIVLQPSVATGVAETENLRLPVQVALKGNYPNPFNPETTIGFYLPSAGTISIKVYNILGRLVKVLIDEHMTAGDQSVVWHGLDSSGNPSPSGIYMVVLKTGKQVKCHRIVLSQ